MQHQDWKPVIIHTKAAALAKEKEKAKAIPQGNSLSKLEKQVDAGEKPSLPILNFDMRKKMIESRILKKYTQKDLAVKCNLPIKTIQDLENGTPIVLTQSRQVLDKVKRTLGIELRF